MSIIGVGTDVVDVTRVTRLIDRRGRRFLDRWLRPPEVEFCLASSAIAGSAAVLFASKEAAWKSLGAVHSLGAVIDGSLPWRQIEVTHGHGPGLRLHGAVLELATAGGVATFHISMSHTPEWAIASVVAVGGRDHAPA